MFEYVGLAASNVLFFNYTNSRVQNGSLQIILSNDSNYVLYTYCLK